MKCLFASLSVLLFGVHLGRAYQDPTSRQVEVFVNVYDHPKTGFSCLGKNPGEYYADPATKCAVYYVCIPNPTGTLSPQSFACPNGTIFSQATRVCRPHEEVFCPLSSRFYDSVHGDINTKYEAAPLPMPVKPLALEPVPPPRRQNSAPATRPRQLTPVPAAPVAPASVPAPTKPTSQSNPFNRGYRNRGAVNQPISTTSTTTLPPPPQPAPGPADYEYDYADYNETNLNAASSSQAAIQTVSLAKASSEPKAVVVEVGSELSKKEPETTVVARRKRDSNSMLSRRKGQLSDEPVSAAAAESEPELSTSSAASSNLFTCQDKITGVAYADVASQCKYFYVCVSVAKGKLWPYRLECDPGKRFNQILGMCDQNTLDRTCTNSEHYYVYNKLYKPSKKHLLDLAGKSQAQ